ncbi:hypothetical protein A2U01_0032026, partial [Trifolium medium]|nr:hypothetical protein [Trifolium medium]
WVNGYQLEEYFRYQGWSSFFEILNEPVYPHLVKDFWVRAEVFDEEDAKRKLMSKVEEDPANQGKTRVEMGLNEFSVSHGN